MHTLPIALTLACALTAAAGTTTPEPADDVMSREMLENIAGQRLQNEGLGPDSLPNTLFQAVHERTMELIQLRHQMQAIEREFQQLQEQFAALQQFVTDHDQLGQDYQSYQAVLEETRKLTAAQQELKRQRDRAERDRKREEARQKRAQASAAQKQAKAATQRLQNLGFSMIGQEVWLSRSAYAYASTNVAEQHVYFQPTPTGELAPVTTTENRSEIDYTRMTISGSLLNGAATTRNIGVAFVFRDAHGNQIGQETVVIENARPDVPYPFTGELVMASDQPFASHTSWVLFADAAPPATISSPPSIPGSGGPPATP
ncbi:MAG: hypothetical protein QF733_05395 [Phycisphaerales bacterium]|jgi:hypothetical protein|nr:hypothetical protein [Phycisphaerales bacterium]